MVFFLQEIHPLPDGVTQIPMDVVPEPTFKVKFLEGELNGDSPMEEEQESAFYGPERPFFAKVTRNERMTSEDHFQDTRLVEFDVSGASGAGMVHKPGTLVLFSGRSCYNDSIPMAGDVCLVQPSNLSENVEFFYKVFPDFAEKKHVRWENENAKTGMRKTHDVNSQARSGADGCRERD